MSAGQEAIDGGALGRTSPRDRPDVAQGAGGGVTTHRRLSTTDPDRLTHPLVDSSSEDEY